MYVYACMHVCMHVCMSYISDQFDYIVKQNIIGFDWNIFQLSCVMTHVGGRT